MIFMIVKLDNDYKNLEMVIWVLVVVGLVLLVFFWVVVEFVYFNKYWNIIYNKINLLLFNLCLYWLLIKNWKLFGMI